MLLVFDVGNTNIVLGVFNNSQLVADWRISTNRERTADEYGIILKELFATAHIDMSDVKDTVISTVVPPLTYILERVCEKYLHHIPLIVGPGIKTGLPVNYENPREVGADRIVNAVAGIELYGCPLIIIDFGTATTYCAINAKGEYLGGAIAPGIGISMEALFMRAAKLPRVELMKPASVIGKNTVSSMQSGIYFGYVGQVDEIIKRMKNELNADAKAIATGGLADLIFTESREIDHVDHNLTLTGLRLIYERNLPK
jgi:type III pantothenate kinase